MAATLPEKSVLHRMGFYSNQEGIAMRYIREDDNWKEHLGRTKRFIMNAVKKVQPATITILGSGWLLDIPLGELLRTGAAIKLVDVVHPPDIQKSLAGEPRVEFIAADITGGVIGRTYDAATTREVALQGNISEFFRDIEYQPGFDPGMVLSVNVMSQLASLPFEYLLKKGKVDRAMRAEFAAAVQERHLRFLKRHESVLITDFAEVSITRTGQTEREEIIYCRLPAGKMRSEWGWHFDSGGSYRQGFRTTMEVVAVHL